MRECDHEWDLDIDEAEILEVEYTHILARVKCTMCGVGGYLDSDLTWKPVFWDDSLPTPSIE